MASFNKVLLMGNLTRDPELKYLPSGTAVVEFGLAMNRRWKDRESGQPRESTTFVDCKSMGRQAEVLKQYMTKGRPIFIEGRLDFRSWEAQDGSKRHKLEVFIENFQFLGSGREGGAPRPQEESSPASGNLPPANGAPSGPPSGEAFGAGAGGPVDDGVPF